jgi:excisionase family DNA binding protein
MLLQKVVLGGHLVLGMQKFYTQEGLAELLSLELDVIAELVRTGKLRAYSIAGELRIGEADLEQYLAGCVVQSTAPANGNDISKVEPSQEGERKECKTFGGRTTFVYSGSVLLGTTIWPGQRTSYRLRFDADQWAAMLAAFRGKEVRAGLSFSNPEAGSFGQWLKIHWNTKMGPAAYVGGILIHEGYAERPRPGWIKIFGESTRLRRAHGKVGVAGGEN